jgi:hypothetical protein
MNDCHSEMFQRLKKPHFQFQSLDRRPQRSVLQECEATVTVSGSKFTGNLRGGVYSSTQSNVTLEDSEFSTNLWAAVIVGTESKGSGSNLKFEENTIGLNVEGEFTFTGSQFTKHKQAAVRAAGIIDATDCIGCPITIYPNGVSLSQEIPNLVHEQPREIDGLCENLGFPCAKLAGKTMK